MSGCSQLTHGDWHLYIAREFGGIAECSHSHTILEVTQLQVFDVFGESHA